MHNKKIFIIVFIVVALVQLAVPVKMILDREDILNNGKLFKFKTQPVDPLDVFRGNYITLSFDASSVRVKHADDWTYGETVYVTLKTDRAGYAQLTSISKQEPQAEIDFIKAKVGYSGSPGDKKIEIEFPFDRFYMEEFKAPKAELLYRRANINNNRVAYAQVFVKEGRAVINDVIVDGKPIQELAKELK